MQVWQDERGDRLYVYDQFRLMSVDYRKRYKKQCIVVASVTRKFHLHFSDLEKVRVWMNMNDYKLLEE